MFAEFYKILLDEPGKISKVSLRFLELLTSVIFAEAIYRYLFGSYHLIQFSNSEAWMQFLFSGRIFLVLGCFLFSKNVILSTISGILLFTAEKLFRHKTLIRIGRKDMTEWLQRFSVVTFDKENKIPSPGRNFSLLYAFCQSFTNEDDEVGIYTFKHSLINEVLTQYLAILIIYFFMLNTWQASLIFSWLAIIGFVFMYMIYLLLNNLVDYMTKHHSEIMGALDFIKERSIVSKQLSNYNTVLFKSENRLGKEEHFEINQKKYAIIFPFQFLVKDKKTITDYVAYAENQKTHYYICIPSEYVQNENIEYKDNFYTSFVLFEDFNELETRFAVKLHKHLVS